jgi:long-chain acyl-CoA synthetase
MRLVDYLLRYGREKEDKPFLSLDGRTLTYGDALKEAAKTGELLKKESVSGRVIGIYADEPEQQILYFLASEYSGAVPLLIHEYLKGDSLRQLLSERPIDFFLSPRPYNEKSRALTDGLYINRLRENGEKKSGFAVLTSGSTGLPEIYFRRDESWTDFFPVQNRIFNVNGDSVLYLQGSMAFTGNFNMAAAFLAEGAEIAGMSRLLPRRWLEGIRECKATHVYMIPSKLAALSRVKGSAEGVQYILTGSQLMTEKTISGLARVLPGAQTILYYGASELSYVSYIEGDRIREKPDSVGKPFPNVHVTFQNGEIYVDCPYMVEGISAPYTCHDLGYMDEEGDIHFLGRREDVYNIRGNHVSRQKVLSHLLMVPGVEDAEIMAHGSDEEKKLFAFVSGADLPSDSAIIRELGKKLLKWEIPKTFIRLPSIPRTSTGKTDRKKLTQLISEREKTRQE